MYTVGKMCIPVYVYDIIMDMTIDSAIWGAYLELKKHECARGGKSTTDVCWKRIDQRHALNNLPVNACFCNKNDRFCDKNTTFSAEIAFTG